MYKWVLLRHNNQILSCLIDTNSDRTLEIHADPDDDTSLRIGDIMTGRIDRIMHGLDAAFINLPGGQKGYLPIRELDHAFFTTRAASDKYCQGDELLVQVRQEAMKTKVATVTTELSITDTLVVVGMSYGGSKEKSSLITTVKAGQANQESQENQQGQENQDNSDNLGATSFTSTEIRVSKKLDAAARRELKEFGESILPDLLSMDKTKEVLPDKKKEELIFVKKPEKLHSEEKSEKILSTKTTEKLISVKTTESFLDNVHAWLLFRTEAATILREGEDEKERIIAEAKHAIKTLHQIIDRAPYLAFGAVHYRSPAAYLRRITGTPVHEIEKIITDDEMLFRELMGTFYPYVVIPGKRNTGVEDTLAEDALPDRWLRNTMKECNHPLIEFYRDSMVSLFNLQSMTRRLEEALNKTVYLKSGGSLVIEHTEALNVIDVNTGKSEGSRKKGADKEKELLKLNLEAAAEAARQIWLRNLSGIIIIDFINMRSKENEKQLMDRLGQLLAADPVETKLVDMTRLGLVEITRKKVERSIYEMTWPVR